MEEKKAIKKYEAAFDKYKEFIHAFNAECRCVSNADAKKLNRLEYVLSENASYEDETGHLIWLPLDYDMICDDDIAEFVFLRGKETGRTIVDYMWPARNMLIYECFSHGNYERADYIKSLIINGYYYGKGIYGKIWQDEIGTIARGVQYMASGGNDSYWSAKHYRRLSGNDMEAAIKWIKDLIPFMTDEYIKKSVEANMAILTKSPEDIANYKEYLHSFIATYDAYKKDTRKTKKWNASLNQGLHDLRGVLGVLALLGEYDEMKSLLNNTETFDEIFRADFVQYIKEPLLYNVYTDRQDLLQDIISNLNNLSFRKMMTYFATQCSLQEYEHVFKMTDNVRKNGWEYPAYGSNYPYIVVEDGNKDDSKLEPEEKLNFGAYKCYVDELANYEDSMIRKSNAEIKAENADDLSPEEEYDLEEKIQEEYDAKFDSYISEGEELAKKYNSANFYKGISAMEIDLLANAEKYHVDGADIPETYYGMKNTGSHIQKLVKKGFLEISTIEKSIYAETNATISKVLKEKGLKASGKKDVLIQRLFDNIPSIELEVLFPRRLYALTEAGRQILEDIPYIKIIMEANCFDVFGFTIHSAAKAMYKNPSGPYRDILIRALVDQIKKQFDAGLFLVKWEKCFYNCLQELGCVFEE